MEKPAAFLACFSQNVWQDRVEARLLQMVDFAFGDYMMAPETGDCCFDLLSRSSRFKAGKLVPAKIRFNNEAYFLYLE